MSSFSFNPLEIFGLADIVRAKLPWQWQPYFTTWLILSIASVTLAAVFLALHFFLRERPKIDWVFEKTGYPVRLGWSLRDGVHTYSVPAIDLGGENISGHSLHQLDGEIVLHRDQSKLPLLVIADGNWVPIREIEAIRPRTIISIGAQFREEGLHWPNFPREMTPDEFLRDFGGFTYTIIIDGDKRTWSFTIDELRDQIEQQKREIEDRYLRDPLHRPNVKKKAA